MELLSRQSCLLNGIDVRFILSYKATVDTNHLHAVTTSFWFLELFGLVTILLTVSIVSELLKILSHNY